MTAPIKTCDYCSAGGVMPTFMDGETVCYDCLPRPPKTLREARHEIISLRTKIEQMESRIELLEHDLKSGDYETLYAQTVAELTQLRKDADKFDDGIDWVQRALQAEARIERMEQQEPVGTLHDDGYFVWRKTAPYESNYGGWKMALYALPGAQNVPSFADAYQGAMEDVAIWKKRALEAEELNRKFIAEINGPTYMGEPAQPATRSSNLQDMLMQGSAPARKAR